MTSKRSHVLGNIALYVGASLLVLSGLYVLVLLFAPRIHVPVVMPASSIDLNVLDDTDDKRDRIQIAKLNLEVPFSAGTVRMLEKGAWHRFPERGNPVQGGNFILSAHRFNLGLTPQGTKARSPFYNIHKLAAGDVIKVFYRGTAYDYKVTRTYSVKPHEASIEAPSDDARLTLYSCTLKGSADGRVVVEARPV